MPVAEYKQGIDMRKQTLMVAVIAALAAGSIVGGTTIALAQADPVKERQENRKATAGQMRAIKGVIDAKGDVKTIVANAAKLKELEAAFIKLFPAGSDKDTKALPTVWSDMPGFLAASKNVDAAYDKLAVAAGSGDLAAVTAAFGDTGKACGACHEKYRAKAN
jgi:cytochrome c556